MRHRWERSSAQTPSLVLLLLVVLMLMSCPLRIDETNKKQQRQQRSHEAPKSLIDLSLIDLTLSRSWVRLASKTSPLREQTKLPMADGPPSAIG